MGYLIAYSLLFAAALLQVMPEEQTKKKYALTEQAHRDIYSAKGEGYAFGRLDAYSERGTFFHFIKTRDMPAEKAAEKVRAFLDANPRCIAMLVLRGRGSVTHSEEEKDRLRGEHPRVLLSAKVIGSDREKDRQIGIVEKRQESPGVVVVGPVDAGEEGEVRFLDHFFDGIFQPYRKQFGLAEVLLKE